jgi:cytochrome c
MFNTKVGSRQFLVNRVLRMTNRLLHSACFLLLAYWNGKKVTGYAIVIWMSFLLASCGKPDNARLVQEGKALLETQDCKTCHHPTNKSIGPAHTTVAEKYEYTDDNVTLLAGRIIKGGSGTWGDVPMNPHPDLSQEDAEKIARYVLSLDGEQPN